MSNLREQIRKELTGVAQRVELRIRTGSWDDNTYQDPDEATSRIMALIAEAMLSDESVETTARSVVAADPSNADTWEALSPYMQEVMVAYARSHAIAALAAAGITGAGQEGGVGE